MDTNNKAKSGDAEIFLKCDCHGEAIMVSKFGGEEEFYFSYWGAGVNPKSLRFSDKIKLCWKVLVHGNPYVDEVILNKAKAKELAAFLVANTESPVNSKRTKKERNIDLARD